MHASVPWNALSPSGLGLVPRRLTCGAISATRLCEAPLDRDLQEGTSVSRVGDSPSGLAAKRRSTATYENEEREKEKEGKRAE